MFHAVPVKMWWVVCACVVCRDCMQRLIGFCGYKYGLVLIKLFDLVDKIRNLIGA